MVFLSSCDQSFHKIVGRDLDSETPRLVVHCLFSPDSSFVVEITRSLEVQEQTDNIWEWIGVRDATVVLLDEASIADTLAFTPDSLYENRNQYHSKVRPKPGHTYTLKVSAPGFEPVTATSTVPSDPPNVEIETADQWHYPSNDLTNTFFPLTVTLNDPVGQDDYYHLRLEADSTLKGIGYTSLTWKTQDPILLEYVREAFQYDAQDRYHEYVYFPDDLFDGRQQTFTISAQAIRDQDVSNFQYGVYVVRLSREFYLWRRTVDRQQQVRENPLVEPVPVYTNVQGGYGIFAGYHGRFIPFTDD